MSDTKKPTDRDVTKPEDYEAALEDAEKALQQEKERIPELEALIRTIDSRPQDALDARVYQAILEEMAQERAAERAARRSLRAKLLPVAAGLGLALIGFTAGMMSSPEKRPAEIAAVIPPPIPAPVTAPAPLPASVTAPAPAPPLVAESAPAPPPARLDIPRGARVIPCKESDRGPETAKVHDGGNA